jgi:GDP-mannose 6-dehydrogenase
VDICVIGLGYVGSVSCGCLAALGHRVIGVDVNIEKVAAINEGRPPVLEPGLDALVENGVREGRIRATTDARDAIPHADAVLICVGTPSNRQGTVQTGFLTEVCEEIVALVNEAGRPLTVINRSTCLPRIHALLQDVLGRASDTEGEKLIAYVCHPEFLREGVAVADFYNPPKIVFGTESAVAIELCRQLYPQIEAPVFVVSVGVASLIKYASNCYHAVKITFANEIGMLSQELGVNAREVMDVFMSDTKLNISSAYLKPGAPFGGSCLPKDLRAVMSEARHLGVTLPMLDGVLRSNTEQIEQIKQRIHDGPHRSVGIVGLAFKENTDDVRESPMVALVEWLIGKGSQVRIYDAYLATERLVGANRAFALTSIPHLTDLVSQDLCDVVERSDLILVSHQVPQETWKAARWRKDQRVIDLVGLQSVADGYRYEGLYWQTAGDAARLAECR